MIWFKRSFIFLGLLITTLADLNLATWSQLAYSLFFSFIVITIVSTVQPLPVALRWAVGQGCMLDLFSPSPFGVYMVSLVGLVCCTQALQHSWLKQGTVVHQLLVSMVAMMLATGLFFGLHRALYYFHLIDRNITVVARFSSSLVGFIIATSIVLIVVRYLQRYDRYL